MSPLVCLQKSIDKAERDTKFVTDMLVLITFKSDNDIQLSNYLVVYQQTDPKQCLNLNKCAESSSWGFFGGGRPGSAEINCLAHYKHFGKVL